MVYENNNNINTFYKLLQIELIIFYSEIWYTIRTYISSTSVKTIQSINYIKI